MENNIFKIELKTLDGNLSRLKKENPTGGFVVINGDEILGVWGSRIDALKEGIKKYGDVSFLVKNLNEVDRILNFSRNIIA